MTCGAWRRPIKKARPWRGLNRICLLNQEHEIRGWNDPEWTRLWAYNLHYFDYSEATSILRWIAENEPGKGVGWEPYPTSRRIVNWIKFALSSGAFPIDALGSLATQAEHLFHSIEYRVLANHILANATALIFAGTFFDGPAAQKWRTEGLRIFNQELQEQILADGGHFERSPMYHSIVLEDVLDLKNLADHYAMPIPGILGVGGRMCGWLRAMMHTDGEIPFFNDAAFGVAASPAELFDYATRLGVDQSEMALNESGYVRLENAGTVVLFDAAPIGPDYQPGHAHADTLSFEMSSDAGRVLVNSGTSTYERGKQRDWERGTAAHNTVKVDGQNQSEIWHSFRVGRRARPFDIISDHGLFVQAAHDGYKRLAGEVIHRRSLRLIGRDLEITDHLDGTGTHLIEIFFHIYPGATPRVTLDAGLTYSTRTTTYHPGFNVSLRKMTIIGRYNGKLPACFKSHISVQ